MTANGARSLSGHDNVYVSLVLRTPWMEKSSPKPVLSEQLVERLAQMRWELEGSL